MSNSPILSVHLGAELKRKWTRFCINQGERPSTAMRQIVLKLLNHAPALSMARDEQLEVSDAGKTYRVEIRLKEKELKALQELALKFGYNKNRYVASLVVNHISQVAQFGQFELDQITASNSQLLMTGRSLNQMARKLNTSLESSDQLKVELIEQLSHEIQAHIKVVAGLIEANIERWKRGQP